MRQNNEQRHVIIPPRLSGIINDRVGDKTISIGDIEITNKATYFDVFVDQVDKIVNAFADQQAIELSIARDSKSSSEGYSGKPRNRQSNTYTKKRLDSSDKRGRSDRNDKSKSNRSTRSTRSEKPATSDRRDSKRNSGNSDKPWRNKR